MRRSSRPNLTHIVNRLGDRCVKAQAIRARARAESGQPSGYAPQWWRVSNVDEETSKVYIYDYIGPWDVSAADFVVALDNISTPKIDLHINSGGGDVFDGYAIFQALFKHPANVTAHVDGLAASAASFIAMAANEVLIAKPARMMVHDASGLCWGNPADMRMMADLLDDISEDVAGLYAERSGKDTKFWREAMQANGGFGTWYGSAQAVENGLADRLDDGSTPEAPAEEPTDPPTEPPAPAPEPAEDSATALSQIVRVRARLHHGRGVKK